MSQSPPAYQEYAATTLAQLPFRALTMPERGLYITLKMELWVNRRLPRNPAVLAKILGQPADEVARLLPRVMVFFEVDGDEFFSREHEDYRAVLDDRRARQSKGGKRSSEARNGKRKTPAGRVDAGASSSLKATSKHPGKVRASSLVQNRTEQHSTKQSVVEAVVHDDFVADYESTESASAAAYLKATRG